MNWRTDLENASKNGREILIFIASQDEYRIIQWCGYWIFPNYCDATYFFEKATHWAEIEKPKKEKFTLTAEEIGMLLHRVTSYIPRPDGSKSNGWEYLTYEQQSHSINAVREIYSNSEKSAEELHELWMKPLIEHGWKVGEYSSENKTHPCLVPFDKLPESEVVKDRIWQYLTEALKPYYKE